MCNHVEARQSKLGDDDRSGALCDREQVSLFGATAASRASKTQIIPAGHKIISTPRPLPRSTVGESINPRPDSGATGWWATAFAPSSTPVPASAIAEDGLANLGDTSTLAEPAVVDDLVNDRALAPAAVQGLVSAKDASLCLTNGTQARPTPISCEGYCQLNRALASAAKNRPTSASDRAEHATAALSSTWPILVVTGRSRGLRWHDRPGKRSRGRNEARLATVVHSAVRELHSANSSSHSQANGMLSDVASVSFRHCP
jgi:hypothetical protein